MDLKGAAAVATLALTALAAGPLAAQQPGRGTFTLAEKQYEFSVLSCDTGSDLDERSTYTLYGRGKTGSGSNFEVFVTRARVDGILSHGVTVRVTGGQGARMISRAARSHVSDAWVDGVGDPANGPLVKVEGSRVRAEGRFRDEHNQLLGHGVLEADCGSRS